MSAYYGLLLLLLGAAGLVLGAEPSLQSGGLDVRVDGLIEGVRRPLVEEGYDRVEIPRFEDTLQFPAGVRVYVSLKNGVLYNLTSIHRSGEAESWRREEDNGTVVRVPLGVEDLRLEVELGYRVGFIDSPRKVAALGLERLSLVAEVSLVGSGEDCRGNVDSFALDGPGLSGLRFALGPSLWDRIQGRLLDLLLRAATPLLVATLRTQIPHFFSLYGTYLVNLGPNICAAFKDYRP